MKPRTSGYLIASVLVAVGVIALMLVRSIAVEAVYPVENANRVFATKVWTRILGMCRGSSACAENVRLRREVASLSMLRGDIERLEKENARLRKAVDYVAKNPGGWIAAGVLSFGGGASGVRQLIRVDKGSLAGVADGAIVAVPDGLVGRVTAVTPHCAEVTLLTDSRMKVACEIESASRQRARGVLCGGKDSLVLMHLTGAGEISPRSRVLTSGCGGVFPRGIEVGTFLGVREDAKGLACEGEVQPNVDFSTLEDVFIRSGN